MSRAPHSIAGAIYDESGLAIGAVATDDARQAQREATSELQDRLDSARGTPRTPERIELLGGGYWKQRTYGFNYGDIFDRFDCPTIPCTKGEANRIADALRPAVTASDEEVARKIVGCHKATTNYSSPDYVEAELDIQTITAILSRHREQADVNGYARGFEDGQNFEARGGEALQTQIAAL